MGPLAPLCQYLQEPLGRGRMRAPGIQTGQQGLTDLQRSGRVAQDLPLIQVMSKPPCLV